MSFDILAVTSEPKNNWDDLFKVVGIMTYQNAIRMPEIKVHLKTPYGYAYRFFINVTGNVEFWKDDLTFALRNWAKKNKIAIAAWTPGDGEPCGPNQVGINDDDWVAYEVAYASHTLATIDSDNMQLARAILKENL